jgi:hypothetical protein
MLTDFQRDLAAAGFVGDLFRHTAQSCCLLATNNGLKTTLSGRE